MPVNKVHKRFLAAAVVVGFSVPLTAATANASVVDLASQSNVEQPPETTAEPVAEPTVDQQPATEPAPVPEAQPEPVAEQPPAPQPEAPAPAAEPTPEPAAEPAPAVEQAPAPAAQTQRSVAEETQPAQEPVEQKSVAEESPAPVETPDEGGADTEEDGDTPGEDDTDKGEDTDPEDGDTNEPDNPADPDPDAPIELESGITVDPKVETDDESGKGSVAIEGDTDDVEISVKDANGNSPDAAHEDGRLSIEEYDDGKAYAIHFDDQDGKRKSVVIGDGENTPNQAVEGDVGVRQVDNTTTMKLTNLAIGVKYFLSYQDQVHEFETEDTSYDFKWSLFDIDTSKSAVFDFTLNNLLGLHSTETEGELKLKFGYAAPTTTEPDPEEPGTEPDPDPTDPVDPNPTDPTDPVDPTDPTDPVDPNPTDPTDPTDPVDPTDPTTPTDPIGPGDGGTEPGTPPEGGDEGETGSGEGGGEGDPTDPTTPTDPIGPGDGGTEPGTPPEGETGSGDGGDSGQLTGGQSAPEDEDSDSPERSDSILQELTRGSQEALAADGTDDTVAEAQGRELPYAADGAGSNLLESSPSSSSLLESLANPDQAEDRDETDDSELDVFGGAEDTTSDDKSPETRADAAPVLNASNGWLTGIMISVGSAIVMFFAWLILGKSRRGRHSGDA